MKIFIGADHAGFQRKQKIINYLQAKDYKVEDLGNTKFRAQDDYPDYAQKVSAEVAKKPEENRGILVCDSGVGMQIAANRNPKIRAVNAWHKKIAERSREHNNSNVLCLGADYLSWLKTKAIINIWLETEFSEAKRHRRRVNKLNKK